MAGGDDDKPGEDWRPRPDPTVLTTEALMREIAHLRELLQAEMASHSRYDAQNFVNIEQRFRDRDLLVTQAFTNVSEATAAALASSKEAVEKSETAVAKQLDGIRVLIDTQAKTVDQQISDVKERLDKSEGRGSATTQLIVIGISAVAVIAAVVSVILTVMAS
jgi:hypothetical protein